MKKANLNHKTQRILKIELYNISQTKAIVIKKKPDT